MFRFQYHVRFSRKNVQDNIGIILVLAFISSTKASQFFFLLLSKIVYSGCLASTMPSNSTNVKKNTIVKVDSKLSAACDFRKYIPKVYSCQPKPFTVNENWSPKITRLQNIFLQHELIYPLTRLSKHLISPIILNKVVWTERKFRQTLIASLFCQLRSVHVTNARVGRISCEMTETRTRV